MHQLLLELPLELVLLDLGIFFLLLGALALGVLVVGGLLLAQLEVEGLRVSQLASLGEEAEELVPLDGLLAGLKHTMEELLQALLGAIHVLSNN